MRGKLVVIATAATLAALGARAQMDGGGNPDAGISPDAGTGQDGGVLCTDGGVVGLDGGVECQPPPSVIVSRFPSITGAPLLDIDAIVQDNGPDFALNPNAHVFVAVHGSGADGGGQLPRLNDGGDFIRLSDGGVASTQVGGPLVSSLRRDDFRVDGGVFTTEFEGSTRLFLGENTVTVAAVRPSGAQTESTPQMVRLDPNFGREGDDLQSRNDGLSSASGESAQGCSTTGGDPPWFLLMAVTVILAGLGHQKIRS